VQEDDPASSPDFLPSDVIQDPRNKTKKQKPNNMIAC